MTTLSLGTAGAAKVFAAAFTVALPSPTISQIPTLLEYQVRPVQRATSRSPIVASTSQVPTAIDNNNNDNRYVEFARPTTSHEKLIGEIRRWSLLNVDWDGEGAAKPSIQSMKGAISFVRLLHDDIALPEPMLLGSGHTSLYWNEGSLYADIEFLGDARIAYFIKSHEDKHKGVLTFDSEKMPPVFTALLRA